MEQGTFERRRRSFGAIAELYDLVRPSYPVEAIRWMLGDVPLHVVDLGAGTGIFSRALAGLGHRVTGVDHDPEMLARLRAASPGVEALAGEAEAIPLPDAAADAVVAAQSFHWFDSEEALVEIARVLVPEGIFAPVWNVRDQSIEWLRRLGEIVPAGARASAAVHARAGREFGPLFGRVERFETRHTAEHTAESLLRLAQSRSAYLVAGEAEQRRMEAEITELAAELPERFELPYLTVAFRAVKL